MPRSLRFSRVHPTGWICGLAITPLPCHHFSLLLSHPKEQEEILSSPNFWAWSKISTDEVSLGGERVLLSTS